jgi:adenylate cyclase
VGIGLHAGEAIVGTMGPPAAPILSALGDTVNVTSRLESLTRVHDCSMVVSDACAAAAQVDLSSFPAHEVVVRGRSKAVRYFAVTEPERLSALVDGQEAAAAAMAGP